MDLVTLYLANEAKKQEQRDAAEFQRLRWIAEVADFVRRREELNFSRTRFAWEMGISYKRLFRLESGLKVRERYLLLKMYETCLRLFDLIKANEELIEENRNLRNRIRPGLENPLRRRSVI